MREDLTPYHDRPEPEPACAEGNDGPDKLAEWKRAALENFSRWLDEIEEIPPEESSPEEDAAPDLFSFYQELAALRNEVRKANRRTADTFSQWGESLENYGGTLRSVERTLAASAPPAFSREHCLALVELFDRLARVGDALDRPPPARRLFSATAAWETAWKNVRQGVSIVRDHAKNLLLEAQVRPIQAERQPFDPNAMVAVATEERPDLPPNTVVEVLVAGYERNGEILRPAEVKVTPRRSDT